MSDRETLRVALGARSYAIVVGAGLLAEAGELIGPLLHRRRVVIVTDATVAALHLPALVEGLAAADIAADTITLPPGEETKSFAHYAKLAEDILALGIDRDTTLLALGGGVIGDLTGFAAATLLRGIDYIQIPTTLLAQVDSSVGGKTAIDTRHGKNLVGAFHQPRLVLADSGVLDTLPPRELLAGYAEVVKYGLIRDRGFFDWLAVNAPALLAGDPGLRRTAILKSCTAKAAIVGADERESGERALLNFGHTFGHALEVEIGFGAVLLHGEAVALGMAMACRLSADLGLCPPSVPETVRRHFTAVGLPADLSAISGGRRFEAARLLAHMGKDKKVKDGRITLILLRDIGAAYVERAVDAPRLEAFLAAEACG